MASDRGTRFPPDVRRVEAELLEVSRELHPRPPAVTPEMILDLCGCSHEGGAHHGPDGRGACGEPGCACPAWHPCQVECPDCGATWDELAASCGSCGLTIETIAERCSL